MKASNTFLIVLFTYVFTFFGGQESACQVSNDDIENRLELKLNAPLGSVTTDCTLQWKCLNHALTKKMIMYHNDQWFYFKTTQLDRYFINISDQECRGLRGVQLMVIHGEPCVPDSYKVVDCVSLGNQDDVFLQLDDLEANEEYLVLIDGYLHDFCGFDIEFSDTPKGMPIDDKAISTMSATSTSDFLMELHWSVPDSIAELISRYEVYRRKELEFKSTKIYEVEQGFNSRGVPLLDYNFEDVLPDYGTYQYTIMGVGDHNRLLVSSVSKNYHHIWRADTYPLNHSRNIDSLIDVDDPAYWLEMDLNYPKPCKLKITLFDASSQRVLKRYEFVYNAINTSFKAYIKDFKEKGVFSYRVEIVHLATNEKKSHILMK